MNQLVFSFGCQIQYMLAVRLFSYIYYIMCVFIFANCANIQELVLRKKYLVFNRGVEETSGRYVWYIFATCIVIICLGRMLLVEIRVSSVATGAVHW